MVKNNIYSSQNFTNQDLESLNLDSTDEITDYLLDEGIWINDELSNVLKQYNNCILIGRSVKPNV